MPLCSLLFVPAAIKAYHTYTHTHACCYQVYELARNPSVQKKARKEAEDFFNRKLNPTFEDYTGLKYIDKVNRFNSHGIPY